MAYSCILLVYINHYDKSFGLYCETTISFKFLLWDIPDRAEFDMHRQKRMHEDNTHNSRELKHAEAG